MLNTESNQTRNVSDRRQQGAAQKVPRLMSLKESAQYIGLTVWALRERIWAGQIPFVRFPGGRKIFVDPRDLDKFVETNKTIFN